MVPMPIHKCLDARMPPHRRIPPIELVVPIASDREGCGSLSTNDVVDANESYSRRISYDASQYGEAIRIVRQAYFTAAKALGALTVALGICRETEPKKVMIMKESCDDL